MKKILVFLTLLIAAGSNAQPIIDSAVFTTIFLKNVGVPIIGYYSQDSIALRALVNITGENAMWDFRTATFSNESIDEHDSVARFSSTIPFSQVFSTATHAIIHTYDSIANYKYLRIDETGYYRLGSAEDTLGGGSVLNSLLDPPLRYVALPATYNESWNSFSLPQSNSSSSIELDSIIGTYDGWGTLYVDGSGPIPCIRLKQTTVSIYVSSGFSDTSRELNYVWITPTGLTININTDDAGQAERASYSLPAGSSVHGNERMTGESDFIYIASNPVSEKTTVAITMEKPSEGAVVLIDAMGRRIKTLQSGMIEKGVTMLPLQTSDLANGTYYLRVESQQQQGMVKIIVAH